MDKKTISSRFFISAIPAVILFAILLSDRMEGKPSDSFFINDNDVVVTWGNSITDDGIYPRLIENFILTYYPEWNIEFYNLGWGGDRAFNPGRIRRDMKLCKPTKVTIMLGMNDGRYTAYEEKTLTTYISGQIDLLNFLESYTDPEVMLISTSPYDAYLRPSFYFGRDEKRDMTKYNDTLWRLSSGLRELAMIKGARYVDLFEWLLPIFKMVPEVERSFLVTPDAVHPNSDGQLLMAYKILKEMGASKKVFEVIIDAKAGTIETEAGCIIEQLDGGPGGVSFIRNDRRLPLPVPPSTDPLLYQLFPLHNWFNQDNLIVRGLEIGDYTLMIDDMKVDKVTAGELSDGINLSEYLHTPQMIQAYKVYEATDMRNRAFWTRWRQVYLKNVRAVTDSTPMNVIENDEAVKLMRIEKEALNEQHRLNKPRPHRYRIIRDIDPAVIQQPHLIPVNEFLTGQVSLIISVDSNILKTFQQPLHVFSNYVYAPIFQWGIYQTKSYYCPPFQMYDDGTHGDSNAGDGVYTVQIFVRKDSPQFNFFIQDDRFYRNYWRQRNQSFRNPVVDTMMKAWCSATGSVDSVRISLETKSDTRISWDTVIK